MNHLLPIRKSGYHLLITNLLAHTLPLGTPLAVHALKRLLITLKRCLLFSIGCLLSSIGCLSPSNGVIILKRLVINLERRLASPNGFRHPQPDSIIPNQLFYELLSSSIG